MICFRRPLAKEHDPQRHRFVLSPSFVLVLAYVETKGLDDNLNKRLVCLKSVDGLPVNAGAMIRSDRLMVNGRRRRYP